MEIELRLLDGPSPHGQVRAFDESRISGALHEISIRLGRERVDMTRPGRSSRSVEELCEVRLVGLSRGSTVLAYAVGPVDETLDLPELEWQGAAFSSLFDGLAHDMRPEGVSDEVADSVGDLAQALRTAAPRVGLRLDTAEPVEIVTAFLHRDVWTTPRRSIDEETVTVVGVLEKVDLHSHEFRVRDGVGNALELVDVPRDQEVAQLVGTRVAASGQALRRRGGALSGVHAPVIEPFEWSLPAGMQSTGDDPFAGAPGPSQHHGLDLTVAEFDELMREIGR